MIKFKAKELIPQMSTAGLQKLFIHFLQKKGGYLAPEGSADQKIFTLIDAELRRRNAPIEYGP